MSRYNSRLGQGVFCFLFFITRIKNWINAGLSKCSRYSPKRPSRIQHHQTSPGKHNNTMPWNSYTVLPDITDYRHLWLWDVQWFCWNDSQCHDKFQQSACMSFGCQSHWFAMQIASLLGSRIHNFIMFCDAGSLRSGATWSGMFRCLFRNCFQLSANSCGL